MSHSFDDHFEWCSTLGDFAQVYAEMGLRVLPLARGGKKPGNASVGVHHATRDRNVISDWWRRTPNANIGVATGGGLMVLDLDRHDADGPAEMLKAAQEHGLSFPDPVPWTRTPKNGVHLWMRWPWAGAQSRKWIRPGVDTRGEGGYVVAPPSGLVMPRLEAGQPQLERIVPYTWESGCPCELPEIPVSLAQWLATDPGTNQSWESERLFTLNGQQDVKVLNASEVARFIQPGQRNNALAVRAASLYRRHGTDDRGNALVTEEMRSIWERMDNSGFPWSEVVTILTHARAFVKRKEAEEKRWAESTNPGWLRKMGG